MHLNQSFDAVKSRLGLTQVPTSVNQGPRHTIDAILGLSGARVGNRVGDIERREERECDPVPVSPGAAESAGKYNQKFCRLGWLLHLAGVYLWRGRH